MLGGRSCKYWLIDLPLIRMGKEWVLNLGGNENGLNC